MRTSVFLFHLLELFAALAASFYWFRTKDKSIKPFLWYLWIIVLVETIAMYPYLYEIVDNSLINSIENSKFKRNSWLYNMYSLVAVFLIGKFLAVNTNNTLYQKVIKILTVGYVIFSIGYYVFTRSFFEHGIPYHTMITTFVIFTIIVLYLFDLMKSEKILTIGKSPVFNITVALLLWYICITPLFIFDSYYLIENKEFISFRRNFLDTSNIILYSWYTFAFLNPLRDTMRLAQN